MTGWLGEIYYDRGDVLRQLGVFHGAAEYVGTSQHLWTHPITIARAFVSKLLHK